MFGKGKGSSGSRGGSGGSYLTPKNYMNTKGAHKGMYKKPNNDGNLWTRRSPNRKPGYSGCFISTAVTRAAGLSDDCYELSVLRMFRREYVGSLPDREKVLADYRERAPKIVRAIDELPGDEPQRVFECLYAAGIVPAVQLITDGEWEEAYHLYCSMCRELEAIFLEESPEGHDARSRVDLWIQAKLAEAPIQALDAAARGGIVPLEDWRSHGWRLHKSLRIEEEDLKGSHA